MARADSAPTGTLGRMAGRTLLVAAVGGLVIGSASGSLIGPVIGPVVAGAVGLVVGLITGGATVAIGALMIQRWPEPSARAARPLILLPTILVAGSTAIASGLLLGAGWWSGEDVAPLVAFGITGPLALILAASATPWCLGPAIRNVRRPNAGRLILLPSALIVGAAVVMLTLGMLRT
jgi:hypothetical protein